MKSIKLNNSDIKKPEVSVHLSKNIRLHTAMLNFVRSEMHFLLNIIRWLPKQLRIKIAHRIQVRLTSMDIMAKQNMDSNH